MVLRWVLYLYSFRVFTNSYIRTGLVTLIGRGQGTSFHTYFGDNKFGDIYNNITLGTKVNFYCLGDGRNKKLGTRGVTLVKGGTTGVIFLGRLGIVTWVHFYGKGRVGYFLVRRVVGTKVIV